MCGGTPFLGLDTGDEQGLSSRVRGNPLRFVRGALIEGSIPACAGEPSGAGDRGLL